VIVLALVEMFATVAHNGTDAESKVEVTLQEG
jgi:hypothetical protein